MCALCSRVVFVGGRGGFGVVVTPTHSHHSGGKGKLCRCFYSATTCYATPPYYHHHPANIRRVGGWWWWVGGGGGCSPCGQCAPTHPDSTIHSTAPLLLPPPAPNRAAVHGRPAGQAGAQLRTARLEGLNFRGIQMQTRGNFFAGR